MGNIGDRQDENVDGGALTPDKEHANNNFFPGDDDDCCEDDTLTLIPIVQENADYKPVSVVKVKWEPERQLKTTENDVTK